jgi:hypothetical protein
VAVESTPAFIQFDGEVCRAYNEVAFRYFLEIERKRAEHSARPLLLMLVTLRKFPRAPMDVPSGMFARIFSALAACVREVDFVGWYREGAVAAAVLVPSGPVSATVRHHLSARALRALKQRLSPDEAARVGVRVVTLGRSPRM